MLKALLSATMFFVPIMAVMMIVVFAVDSIMSIVPQDTIEALIQDEERE